jgi:hypothetical protein
MSFRSESLGEGIIYLPDFSTLFCTKHESAIPFRELKYHLRLNREHKLPPAIWQPIFDAAQVVHSGLQTTVAELVIPPHGSEPLPFLPILDGVRCRACSYVRGTRKEDGVLKAHIEKEHPRRRGQKWQDTMEEVKVQRWVNDTRGTYWIVGNFGRGETSTLSKTSYEQVMEALEAEEDMELEEDAKRNQQEDDAKGLDESTPWLKHYTKWPTRFKGRPLNILAITKKPPATSPKSRRAGLTAGTHRGVTIRWDGQFEERLYTIMVALRQMLERCLSTLDTTET